MNPQQNDAPADAPNVGPAVPRFGTASRDTSIAAKSRTANTARAGLSTEVAAAFENEFTIESADTPEIAEEAYRLRHQVYCLERGYEAGQGGVERDGFDAHARHVLLRRRATRQVVGTV